MSAKSRRVQMDMSPSSFDRLNRLKETVDASTYTEIMKDALRLYEYFIQEDSKGRQFLVKDENGNVSEVKIFA